MTPEERELTALVQGARASAGAFRPFAIFDEQLDCIRVVWRDCSANEIRVSKMLTILEDNHPESEELECVGFTIKGVAHICETRGISADAPWLLADFIDAVVALDPAGRYAVRRDIRSAVKEHQLREVESQAA